MNNLSSEPDGFTLSKRELEVISLIWESGRPLSRAEIAGMNPEKEWRSNSIHILLNRMMEKGAIEVAGFIRTGKVYGRTYQATLSWEEYATMQFFVNIRKANGDVRKSSMTLFRNLINSDFVDDMILLQVQDLLKERKASLQQACLMAKSSSLE